MTLDCVCIPDVDFKLRMHSRLHNVFLDNSIAWHTASDGNNDAVSCILDVNVHVQADTSLCHLHESTGPLPSCSGCLCDKVDIAQRHHAHAAAC